jgi:hypothetical protein
MIHVLKNLLLPSVVSPWCSAVAGKPTRALFVSVMRLIRTGSGWSWWILCLDRWIPGTGRMTGELTIRGQNTAV